MTVLNAGNMPLKPILSRLMKGSRGEDQTKPATPSEGSKMSNFFRMPAVLLGISFLVIFSGFSTLENLQKTLLASVHDEVPSFQGDGYTSLGILYSMFAISIWFSPSIIAVTGPVVAMVIGATGYVLFPITFILESTFYLYFGAFMNGIGSSLLWTGQANYLILNSKPGAVSKNVGLFWVFYMLGMLPGNLIVFFAFKDKRKHIDQSTRRFILTVLSVMMGIGVIIMYFLRRPKERRRAPTVASVSGSGVGTNLRGPMRAFRTALRLCVTSEMLWLMLPFCYAGLHLTFFSSVYSASVGFTLKMGESTKQLVPLAGFLTGVGEIIGGILPFILNGRKLCGLSLIMLTGIVSNLLSYGMTYINIPDVAAFGNTWESSLIPPNECIAVLCSFLMGLGDCCVHTELYSILGTIYPNESAEVFAVFKFVRCLCTAADFYCSPFIGLHIQLFIQTLFAILCLLCYIILQLKYLNAKPFQTHTNGKLYNDLDRTANHNGVGRAYEERTTNHNRANGGYEDTCDNELEQRYASINHKSVGGAHFIERNTETINYSQGGVVVYEDTLERSPALTNHHRGGVAFAEDTPYDNLDTSHSTNHKRVGVTNQIKEEVHYQDVVLSGRNVNQQQTAKNQPKHFRRHSSTEFDITDDAFKSNDLHIENFIYK
uniref:UNC93-like protein MFSD11 n=1 Tax=Cacopsylla melanoneura TaxID=428564 RepID=A0A8D8YGK7_9HEMI